MRRVPLLVIGVLVVVFVTGCGRTNPALIPPSNAQAMQNTADRIAAACSAHDRSTAREEVRNAQREIDELPSSTSKRLRANLEEWVAHIRSRISSDCQPAETPTPTPTESPSPTPTSSPTPTPTPTPTETPTATESPTVTATATATATDTATPPAVQTTTPEGQ